MARRGVRKQDHERLDDLNINRVVKLLEQNKPITKKAACETLNINYSTSRLAKIIQEYKDKIEYAEKRRKYNKGRAFSDLETQDIVISYLSGESVSNIADRMFRSSHIIKKHINDMDLPIRSKTTDYTNPEMMPDEMVSEEFDLNEYVWSAKYNCVASVIDGVWDIRKQINIYKIYIFGKFMQFGYQPAYELGKLDILKQFKIRDDEFQTATQDFNLRI